MNSEGICQLIQRSQTLLSFEAEAMAVATQLGMCASSFLCPSPLTSKPGVIQPACRSSSIVCQGNSENLSVVTSRRAFAVAAGFATTLGVFAQPQAAEAKRNKPPPPEEKKAEVEDKSLSAYDARLLANARRKEAMKENIDKLKSKSIGSGESVGTSESVGAAEPVETGESAS